MGQDIYTKVVAGAKFDLIHSNKRKDSTITRYETETGLPYQKEVYEWVHVINGREYTEKEYTKEFFGDRDVELFYADSGGDPEIIGKNLEDNFDGSMVKSIDLDKAKLLLEETKILLESYGIKPEDVKLYSIAVWSY